MGRGYGPAGSSSWILRRRRTRRRRGRASPRAARGPVYVRKQIVHNLHVVRDLEDKGAVFVEELDEVPEGAVVVLSAHGSSPTVHADAERRGALADRRDVSARHQGPPRGAPVRRRRPDDPPDRPRGARGGRRDERAGARSARSSSSRSRRPQRSRSPTPPGSPTSPRPPCRSTRRARSSSVLRGRGSPRSKAPLAKTSATQPRTARTP